MTKGMYNAPAPGDLELLRELLNTWRIPSATRRPEDQLPALLADSAAWATRLPALMAPSPDSLPALTALRDDLRALAARDPAAPSALADWLRRYPVHAFPAAEGAEPRLRFVSSSPDTALGALLAIYIEAVATDAWPRIKVCPDCQWVFYDHSRSKTKIWCDMLSGDAGGRSCGTIAKVQRYKERHGDARPPAGLDR